MLVRDSRTSSANGAFGRHDRQDNAGMRLVNCRVVVTVERSFLMQVKELPTNNLFIYCFGRRVRGQVSPRRNLWTSLFSEWPLWRFQRVPHRPRRCTPATAWGATSTGAGECEDHSRITGSLCNRRHLSLLPRILPRTEIFLRAASSSSLVHVWADLDAGASIVFPFMSPPFGGSQRIWRRENLKDSVISWLLFASIVSVGIWGV